jgi:hypothetical protein
MSKQKPGNKPAPVKKETRISKPDSLVKSESVELEEEELKRVSGGGSNYIKW